MYNIIYNNDSNIQTLNNVSLVGGISFHVKTKQIVFYDA